VSLRAWEGTCDRIVVRVGSRVWLRSRCSASPSPGSWHTVQIHVRTGANGLTEVWLDGSAVTALSQTQALGSGPIGRVQIGNNQTARTYDVLFDDVVVDTARI